MSMQCVLGGGDGKEVAADGWRVRGEARAPHDKHLRLGEALLLVKLKEKKKICHTTRYDKIPRQKRGETL